MPSPRAPFGPSLIGAWSITKPGVYVIFILAKVAADFALERPPSLLAPSFYLRVTEGHTRMRHPSPLLFRPSSIQPLPPQSISSAWPPTTPSMLSRPTVSKPSTISLLNALLVIAISCSVAYVIICNYQRYKSSLTMRRVQLNEDVALEATQAPPLQGSSNHASHSADASS
mmetsp:Transcript_76296/g.127129  ORF Transcript_76296/g.127129 Transcript_76296/m.127129 type:complete len:171 (+) Transcript_76296:225-737(+)